jgi:hypothetical protein
LSRIPCQDQEFRMVLYLGDYLNCRKVLTKFHLKKYLRRTQYFIARISLKDISRIPDRPKANQQYSQSIYLSIVHRHHLRSHNCRSHHTPIRDRIPCGRSIRSKIYVGIERLSAECFAPTILLSSPIASCKQNTLSLVWATELEMVGDLTEEMLEEAVAEFLIPGADADHHTH